MGAPTHVAQAAEPLQTPALPGVPQLTTAGAAALEVITLTAGSGTHDSLLPTDVKRSKSSVRNSSSSASESKRRRPQGSGAVLTVEMRITHSKLQNSMNNR